MILLLILVFIILQCFTTLQNHYTNIKVDLNLKEIIDSIMKLKNNRSFVHDEIQAELMKLLHITTIEKLTHIINTTINNDLPHKLRLVILIQKQNKTKTNNTIINKTISNITLARISSSIEKFISHNQAAYRKRISTKDVI